MNEVIAIIVSMVVAAFMVYWVDKKYGNKDESN